MKISKYTKLLKYNDKYFIYNSLSNFLCEIDVNLFAILNNKQQSKNEIVIDEIDDNDTWNLLVAQRIISQNDKDDLLEITSSFEKMRRVSQSLNLTLAPTMDCNFHCPYCFETKKRGVMTNKTVVNVIHFVKNYDNIKNIFVTWFGGEPLLYPEVIKKISNEISILGKHDYSAQIITNGYNLTIDNIKLLIESKVNLIQLSMDGIFEHHNKTRFTKTDNDTFTTIIKNIDCFHKTDLDVSLIIRINLDNKNIHTYKGIHNFFTERYENDKRIVISPAFIQDTTKKNNNTTITDFDEKLKFWQSVSTIKNTNEFLFPNNSINECAIRNYNSWAIDAKGFVYKCWEIIGNEDYKVGVLTENGINITNETLLRRYLFGANHLESQKCRECFSLPVCNGGCPHKRIENEFSNKNFNMCTYKEENLEKLILERIKKEYL